MNKLNYLNVGCGSKFHKAWTNVDMVASSPYVETYNILRGLPYPENYFDVVYHSQVLEHIPKEKAFDFLKECYRVLKPGGILRVVCPDLENICKEYLRHLNDNVKNPSDISMANYDWILLEMYDQTVRNRPGGEMAAFLQSSSLLNKDYIVDRIGCIDRTQISTGPIGNPTSKFQSNFFKIKRAPLKKIIQFVVKKFKTIFSTNIMRIGSFRLGGEVHMWMYDRFSLSRLLSSVGFSDIERMEASKSSIPYWESYELDIKDGKIFDPTSLFMEAKKPF